MRMPRMPLTRLLNNVFGACAGLLVCAAAPAAEIADGVRLSGDLRVRNESLNRNDDWGADDLDRMRLRLRLALDMKLDDSWDASLRLATSGGATSTNQDLGPLDATGSNAAKATAYIDRAFARYRTSGGMFELTAGRTANPYACSMMLWDSDYNPDGIAEKLSFGEGVKVSLTAGVHVLQLETMAGGKDKRYDGSFVGVQPAVEVPVGQGKLTAAVAYYHFAKCGGLNDVPAADEAYAIADGYVCFKTTLGEQPLSLWADGLRNVHGGDDKDAYGCGVSIGSTKKGSVKAGLSYMFVQEDAIWINLCDANFTSGLTTEDMHGVVFSLAAGVGKGATFGVTVFHKESLDTRRIEDQVEVDLLLKF